MWRIIFSLFIACFLSSCDQSLPFPDRYTESAVENRRREMQIAPIIFVGVVKTIQVVGTHRPAANIPGLTLQLYRARCDAEVILRGKVPSHIEFLYYGPDPRYGMVGFPKFWLRPAQRRIFFLERYKQIYRAVGDYLDYTEWVQSGRPNASIAAEPNLGKAVARIMLTPGQDVDEHLFSGNLFYASRVANEFSSESYAIELLTQLTTNRSPLVRARSCRVLSIFYKESVASCSEHFSTTKERGL